MNNYEKLGAFYLGKEFDLEAGKMTENLLLYDSKDLTTHGVIVGMTGSGKTGLALTLLEEAAIDGIPAIAIDPKGDLGNLLLTFPRLQPEDFLAWVDTGEASRNGMTPDELAKKMAETWKTGLAQFGQDGMRIQRFRDSADVAIYTPGHAAGRPLQILRSFSAPSSDLAQDSTAIRDRVMSAVSGLLGLAGIDADPVQSREHILLSNILDRAWRDGRSLDVTAIINEIQKPPFERIGVFDLESFYPARERFGLAIALNNLIASPGLSDWMEGEPLDIQQLLYSPEGKPRIAILSIAHLSDSERMFFVTILLNEVLAWVRAQSGTSSLRALIYMDEIFGYFPPAGNPPSKIPMLTLLKQARAFGLGVVLSTQNPVDLDYKGLANAGTWWIGRLQTERDKMRVIEGLEGAAAVSGGSFDRGEMERILAGLGSRVFLMRNVHDNEPVVFHSRWALSYLRGPMTLPQIKQFMTQSHPFIPQKSEPIAVSSGARIAEPANDKSGLRPVLPPGISEVFLRPVNPVGELIYRAGVIGIGRLHFVDSKAGVDSWRTYSLIATLGDNGFADWGAARVEGDIQEALDSRPLDGAGFAAIPPAGMRKERADQWRKTLASHLYQNITLDLFECPSLKMTSKPEETEGDFKARIAQMLREQRDLKVSKIKNKYAAKLQTMTDRVRGAEERVAREKAQATHHKLSTALGIGATLLGALTGRRVMTSGNIGRASSTLRRAGRISKEAADVDRADKSLEVAKQRLAELESQFEMEIQSLQDEFTADDSSIVRKQLRPRKSDIAIGTVGLCWTAWKKSPDGLFEPAQ
ncbi:ATP-binding protein [bacterium]|nr:ATP-binding protein [candidate division CSSED10-310 bacterium]